MEEKLMEDVLENIMDKTGMTNEEASGMVFDSFKKTAVEDLVKHFGFTEEEALDGLKKALREAEAFSTENPDSEIPEFVIRVQRRKTLPPKITCSPK